MDPENTTRHDIEPTTARDEHRDERNPMVRLAGILPRLPRYIKLGYLLLRDPNVPAGSKALLGLAVGYTVSPINLIPTFIPVAGQLDDLLALLFGLRQALHTCSVERRERHLESAGVTLETIDNDLRIVRNAGFWLAQRPLTWGVGWLRDRLGGGRVTPAARTAERRATPPLLDRPADGTALPPAGQPPETSTWDQTPGDRV